MNQYTVSLSNNKILAIGTAQECAEKMGLTGGAHRFYDLVGRVRRGKVCKYKIESTLLRDSRLPRWYTVYSTKDDSVLATGTSFDCAKQLNMKNVESFYSMVSRCLRGKIKKYDVVVTNMKEEEDADEDL